jgi:hypothetical protein
VAREFQIVDRLPLDIVPMQIPRATSLAGPWGVVKGNDLVRGHSSRTRAFRLNNRALQLFAMYYVNSLSLIVPIGTLIYALHLGQCKLVLFEPTRDLALIFVDPYDACAANVSLILRAQGTKRTSENLQCLAVLRIISYNLLFRCSISLVLPVSSPYQCPQS